MAYLNSTAIRAVSWDAQTLTLNITFTSGGTYSYYGVPEWKYHALISAASAGLYFHENIRDQQSFNRR
jgi:hypothetical protein